MTHDQELLPCPFCGGDANYGFSWSREDGITSYHVNCAKCSSRKEGFSSEKRAAASWNTRATPCPVTKEEAQAALDAYNDWVELWKGKEAVYKKETNLLHAQTTIRALLERAAKGEES